VTGENLGERVMDVTRDLMRGLSCVVVDVGVVRQNDCVHLQIAIDKDGGVNLDDCAKASELISLVLERESVMAEPYVIEVMSPGIEMPLDKPESYARNVGKRIRLNLRQPYEGTRSLCGFLRDAGDGSIKLEVGQESMELSYESISSARLDPELPW